MKKQECCNNPPQPVETQEQETEFCYSCGGIPHIVIPEESESEEEVCTEQF